MHLGGLLSIQEATVALGYRLRPLGKDLTETDLITFPDF